ncbi:hypothetical protein SEVIR_1G387101v4 [Setaria viridis]
MKLRCMILVVTLMATKTMHLSCCCGLWLFFCRRLLLVGRSCSCWCLLGILLLQVGAPAAVHARVDVGVEARGAGDEVVERRRAGAVPVAGLLRALRQVLVHVADREMRRRRRRRRRRHHHHHQAHRRRR